MPPSRAPAGSLPATPSRPSIVVLHDEAAADGRADAHDVLHEAAHVARALETLGYVAAIEPVGLDLGGVERALARHAPVAAVNLVESLGGRAALIHVVPALLESLGLPFTGCSAAAQLLTSNKRLAKRRLAEAGIATPETWRPGARGGPWIVKSVWEHGSLGLGDDSVVRDAEGVPAAIERRRAEWGGDWFAERFVAGRELNVALIAAPDGPKPLPVAEIRFDAFPEDKPRIVGYAAKWEAESFECRATPRTFGVERSLAERVTRLALRCWDLFGLEGYARVDFRVTASGEPFVLEVNANPCLSPDAGFAAALAAAAIPFSEAVHWLVDDAFRRRLRPAGSA
ncbi:MAG TPA: ATP-grasp domain-containing protein [Gammaproteobacteria bacterium]